MEDVIEEHWKKVKSVILTTAEEVIGFKESREKEWMSEGIIF